MVVLRRLRKNWFPCRIRLRLGFLLFAGLRQELPAFSTALRPFVYMILRIRTIVGRKDICGRVRHETGRRLIFLTVSPVCQARMADGFSVACRSGNTSEYLSSQANDFCDLISQ